MINIMHARTDKHTHMHLLTESSLTSVSHKWYRPKHAQRSLHLYTPLQGGGYNERNTEQLIGGCSCSSLSTKLISRINKSILMI